VSTDEWGVKFEWTYEIVGFTVLYFDKVSLDSQLCCFRAEVSNITGTFSASIIREW